jgi:GT2 family glycosyltransferase
MSGRASIIIPTRERLPYLQVALASIMPQARAVQAEVIVIDDDGPALERRDPVERLGARYVPHPTRLGLNVARNTGVESSSGDLLVFVDDDVQVCHGWLRALLKAAEDHPSVDVFTGPIHPLLEGNPPHSCGREGPPITAVEIGEHDQPVRYAWGTNMTIRRSALERVGAFDVTLADGGDEQEWQDRLRLQGSEQALYVAGAAVYHRRSPADSRLMRLVGAARVRGRAARRFVARSGQRRSLVGELTTLGGCLGHVVRHRCPAGLVMAAHSLGRLQQGLEERDAGYPPPLPAGEPLRETPDFLPATSGTVGGLDALRRGAVDGLIDLLQIASGERLRLALAARRQPRRRILVLCIERPQHRALVDGIRSELGRTRHQLEFHLSAPGELGKFENLNRLLAAHPPEGHDWLLVLDDDVVLPRGFLDRLVFLAERFSLDLAQPAQRLRSHAAWGVTRRRAGVLARQTRFVEIGPVSAFASSTFSRLLPFPELNMGWGLDLHWGALADEQGWRCGVLDALTIGHAAAPAASSYSRDAAVEEARSFLAAHPYITVDEAERTLAVHRRW